MTKPTECALFDPLLLELLQQEVGPLVKNSEGQDDTQQRG